MGETDRQRERERDRDRETGEMSRTQWRTLGETDRQRERERDRDRRDVLDAVAYLGHLEAEADALPVAVLVVVAL